MIAVVQRVFSATVYADGELSGKIGRGLYVLLGVEQTDEKDDAERLVEKLHKLRIFADDAGKMNLSADTVGAEAMFVSNFTLCADYRHGNRPEYFSAARPEKAQALYAYALTLAKGCFSHVASGRFGADMRTELVTDGPVTIILESQKLRKNQGRNTAKEEGAML